MVACVVDVGGVYLVRVMMMRKVGIRRVVNVSYTTGGISLGEVTCVDCVICLTHAAAEANTRTVVAGACSGDWCGNGYYIYHPNDYCGGNCGVFGSSYGIGYFGEGGL